MPKELGEPPGSPPLLVVSPNRLSSRERRRVSTAIGGVAEQVWYEWLLAFRARTKPVPQSSDVQVVLPLARCPGGSTPRLVCWEDRQRLEENLPGRGRDR